MKYTHKHPNSAPAISFESVIKLREEKLLVSGYNCLPSIQQLEIFLAIAEGAKTIKMLSDTLPTSKPNIYIMVYKLEELNLIQSDEKGNYSITASGNNIIFYTDPG
jgi:hypothetical protein